MRNLRLGRTDDPPAGPVGKPCVSVRSRARLARCFCATAGAFRQMVDVSHGQGRASVRRGTGLWSRFLARLFGFPPESKDAEVRVTKTVSAAGETWQRCFDNRVFRSRLAASPQGITERFGPFTFLTGLNVASDALHYPVVTGRLGPLPLPGWLLPVSIAREQVIDGRFCFDVQILAPVTKWLLVHYQGRLADAGSDDARARAEGMAAS